MLPRYVIGCFSHAPFGKITLQLARAQKLMAPIGFTRMTASQAALLSISNDNNGVMGSACHSKRHFRSANNRQIYKTNKISTSDDELQRKLVIRNFKNTKDKAPNIIDIDTESGEVRQISSDHDSYSFKNLKAMTRGKLITTFLPNGYPKSVGEDYLRFTTISNVGAMAFTAMSFLSTQALFVALGR